MSTTLSAIVTLAATLAAFGVLAMIVQAVRMRKFSFLRSRRGESYPQKRLGVDEVCAIDAKRRVVLVRYGNQQVLLFTGGPADLLLPVQSPALAAGELV